MRERERKKEEGQEPQRKSETNRLVGHSERPRAPEVPGLEPVGILTLERLPGRSDLRGRAVSLSGQGDERNIRCRYKRACSKQLPSGVMKNKGRKQCKAQSGERNQQENYYLRFTDKAITTQKS